MTFRIDSLTAFRRGSAACLFLLLAASVASAQATAPYVRTTVVSPAAGGPAASGTALLQAVANAPAGSSSRWRIQIEPGYYDLGTTPLQMKPYLDIEGAGPESTFLFGDGQSSGTSLSQGVVQGADHAELRDLQISCTTTAEETGCLGIVNNGVSPKLDNLHVFVSGEANGSHWGIRNIGASPQIENLVITAADGLYAYGISNTDSQSAVSRPKIRHSRIVAKEASFGNYAVFSKDGSAPEEVLDSKLQAFYGTSAGAMEHLFEDDVPGPIPVRIEGSLLTAAYGSSNNRGVYFEFGQAKLTIRDSEINAFNAGGFGVYNSGSIEMQGSKVTGNTFRVVGGEVRIGGSHLAGSGSVSGTTSLVCAGVWDGNFTFYANTCP